MKNPGKLLSWTSKDGIEKRGIAYNKDQVKQFTDFNKIAIKEVDDKLKLTGVASVKNIAEVKFIGYVD